MNVTLHSEDNLHEIGYLATVELLKEEITGLRKENYKNRDDLAALKDKHNRFTGMMMAAMADEIKVMIRPRRLPNLPAKIGGLFLFLIYSLRSRILIRRHPPRLFYWRTQ